MSKWNRNALAERMNSKLKKSVEKADERANFIEKNQYLFEEGALEHAEQAAKKLADIPKHPVKTYKVISKKEYYSK